MKNLKLATLSLAALMGTAALQADNTQKPQVVASAKAAEAVAKLSAEEQAFAAKLSDQHRKAFTDKFSAEQRKVAMTAAKVSTAANAADEAVEKLLSVTNDQVVAEAAVEADTACQTK